MVTAVAVALAAGCGQSPEECIVDEARAETPQPAAPAIRAPTAGRLDIDPATVVFEITPPPAEVRHLESEAEIWRTGGGELLLLAWSVRLEPDLETGEIAASFSLADGELQGISSETGLLDWEDYAVVVRHRILGEGEGCSRWTEWSEPRVFRTDDGSTYLFDDGQILDVELTIGPESFDAINAEARPPGCVPYQRDYYSVDATVDGETFSGAGGRVKGGCGSARTLDQKAAFKVNLSWDDPSIAGCPETRRVHGVKRLTLNNQVQDRSFVHERIGYHFYKLMGVATPRVANVRLGVNGEPWGFYLNVESIDRRMLSRWFESNGGMLYEGTYFCDLVPPNVPESEDDDSMCLSRKFSDDVCDGNPDPGDDPKTYSPLRDFVTAIDAIPDGAFFDSMPQLIDRQAFLSLWAADAIMGHWDGYAYDIINNYRVYHHPVTDLWTIIPTGIDQTFDRDVDPFAVSGILASRCLAEPACEQAFVDRLREGLAAFESADLTAMVEAIDAQITEEVAADPRKEGSVADYDNARAATVDFIARRPDEIRAYIAARGF
jgi:hypothetical protein